MLLKSTRRVAHNRLLCAAIMPPKNTIRKRLGLGDGGPPGRKRARSPPPAEPPQALPYQSSLRKRLQVDDQPESSTTPLYRLLKKRWAGADIPSWQVQEYAEAAQGSGAVGLAGLPKIGAGGRHPQNAQRDIMRALGRPTGAPEFYKAVIPVVGADGEPTTTEHPFILPHEFFASLYAERRDDFRRCVQGDNQERAQLWERFKKLPLVQNHPTLGEQDLGQCIPIGIHADAGKFSHQDASFVITWNSLLGQGPTIEQRFVITAIRKTQLVETGATLNAIFKVISWSLNCMAEGMRPIVDEDDNPLPGSSERTSLAGPWRGLCCQVRGDWQFYCQAFNFPQWNVAGRMCWMCQASSVSERLFWTNFNRDAGWRRTCWDHEAYMAFLAESDSDVPELFSIKGLRLECITIDVLHCVDLGVAQHVIGNTLWEVLPLLGRNRQAQIAELNKRLKRWYTAHRVESRLQGQISEDMLKSKGGWPKLRAKGAATRNMAAFAQCLANEFCDGSERSRRRRAINDALVEYYKILQEEGRFFGRRAQRRLPTLAEELCGFYACLSAESEEAGVKAWKLQPKFHLFFHLCQPQCLEFGNPRFFWCYADEDMVGQMVEVAKSCHPKTLATVALYKYLVLMFDD